MSYHIASVSFGKDSLYMLLLLLEKNYPLDEVVFYDTGMEFNAIYQVCDKVKEILDNRKIKFTVLRPQNSFEYMMFEKSVCKLGTKIIHKKGYSWCGARCRWGTTEKIKTLDKYAEQLGAVVYVGIAVDEIKRISKARKKYKLLPLVDWGVTEVEALQGCYELGFNWIENGIRLYDILDRVSCFCCTNKNLKELHNIYKYLPEYWERLKDLQIRTDRPFKGAGKSIFDLEKRFKNEYRKKQL